MKKAIIGLVLLLLGAGAGLLYLSSKRAAPQDPQPQTAATPPDPASERSSETPAQHNAGSDGAFCGFHQIAEAECPWCDPSLIKSLGHCAGHDVPEALCSRCNAKLIPGFKAEKDWCAGHELPESQCLKCQAGDLPPGERPAAKDPQ